MYMNTIQQEILEGAKCGEFGVLIAIRQNKKSAILSHHAHLQCHMATKLPN